MTKKTVKQQRTSTVHKKIVDDMPTSEDLIEEGRKQGMVQGLTLAIALMYKGENERGI